MNLQEISYRLSEPVFAYHQYQGQTNDCGPTCLAIAANAARDENLFHGPDLAQQLNKIAFRWTPFPRPVVRRVPGWATFPWGMVDYLREESITARWSVLNPPEKLLNILLEDRLAVVVLGQPLRWKKWQYLGWSHYKILYGYTPGRGYVFVDPGRRKMGDTWGQHGLFWQAEEDFLPLWRNMGRILVEVG
jgi:hypothetical protein